MLWVSINSNVLEIKNVRNMHIYAQHAYQKNAHLTNVRKQNSLLTDHRLGRDGLDPKV